MEKTLNTPARAVSRRSLVAFGLTALFAGTLAGCGAKPADTADTADTAGSTPAKAVELQIFAANSLEKAMPEVQALYTEKPPIPPIPPGPLPPRPSSCRSSQPIPSRRPCPRSRPSTPRRPA